MAEIEVNNSGWNSIGGQGKSGLGTVGSILSMIPTPVTQGIGAAMKVADAASKHNGRGVLTGAVSSVADKPGVVSSVAEKPGEELSVAEEPGGDEASFGKELNEAQIMFGDENMNVGGLRTAGRTPTLGSMH